jgi:tRNA A-37 threonylcarbamoyl transferase component Bud32
METKIVKLGDHKVRYVKEVAKEIFHKFYEVMRTFEKAYGGFQGHQAFRAITEMLGEPIGKGCFGRVYDFSEDYVLKVNDPRQLGGVYNPRDGYIMEQLQGIAIIPQVYIYSENNQYILIQKIKGKNCRDIVDSGIFDGLKELIDFKWTKTFIEKCAEEVEARGWKLADCHGSNCMIDKDGKFYIVDVGLFDNLEECEEEWEFFGKSTDYAISSLLAIKEAIERKEMFAEMRLKREQARKERGKVIKKNPVVCPRCKWKKRETQIVCAPCFEIINGAQDQFERMDKYLHAGKYDLSKPRVVIEHPAVEYIKPMEARIRTSIAKLFFA